MTAGLYNVAAIWNSADQLTDVLATYDSGDGMVQHHHLMIIAKYNPLVTKLIESQGPLMMHRQYAVLVHRNCKYVAVIDSDKDPIFLDDTSQLAADIYAHSKNVSDNKGSNYIIDLLDVDGFVLRPSNAITDEHDHLLRHQWNWDIGMSPVGGYAWDPADNATVAIALENDADIELDVNLVYAAEACEIMLMHVIGATVKQFVADNRAY